MLWLLNQRSWLNCLESSAEIYVYEASAGVSYKEDGVVCPIQGKVIKHTDNAIEYEFTVTDTLDDCEFKVTNNSGKSCVLNFIRVRIKE